MRPFVYAVGGITLSVLAFWALHHRPAQPATRTRAVAFDNVYNGATTLQVYAKVDGGDEQAFTAGCNAKTCTFQLPLTSGVHDVTLAIEQNGVRGRSDRFKLDTANVP